MPTLRAGQGGEGNGICCPETGQMVKIGAREMELLQGFPEGYTLLPGAKPEDCERARKKALGNSFAVPVVRWIGRRIHMHEELTNGEKERCQAADRRLD